MSHTKRSTRIAIWIIVIVLTVGTIGAFFITVIGNSEKDAAIQNKLDQQQQEKEGKMDPNAYKVEGAVEKLVIDDLVVGEGKEVKANDNITVHYKGTVAQTGVKIDSSYDRGEPATFDLTGLIEGWQQGLPGMKEGGKRRLVIPASMAYGDNDLVFEIELISVNQPTAQ